MAEQEARRETRQDGKREFKDYNFEKMLRAFKIKCTQEGIVRKLRDRMYYEKPSDKKRKRKGRGIRK